MSKMSEIKIRFNWNQDTLIAVGASKSGKTRFVKNLIKGCNRMIVLDTNYEYANLFKLKAVKNPLDIQVNTALQTVDYSLKTLNNFIIASRRFTDCLVIYEDIDLFLKNVPPDELRAFQINGRHQNLGQIGISHRLIGLPLLMLQKADYLAIWKISALLGQNDVQKYRTAIPTLDLHKQLSRHSKIIYKMDSDVAIPIFYDKCSCEGCKSN